ncbi:dTDP-4-dehydrorhamnose reductase [Candidatus Bathyarchaeota archaeon]|nr:MAG: dTDP-4-dehydrorhamnose reductase [Candidatus Bathyarchaeota archaeon]
MKRIRSVPVRVTMRRLLVVGATGLVGSKLVKFAPNYGYEALSTHNARHPEDSKSFKLDITDGEATRMLLEEVKPEVIVNTAALHNVDYCETHQEEAHRVNVEGTANLADTASKLGSRFIYVSTDYVFDGRTGHYSESDVPNPLHYYARTKVEGEAVASKVPSYAIARPSVIYGWNPLEATGIPSSSGKTVNFAMYVLDKFGKNETVKAVNDQFSSPTFADNMAEAVLRIASFDGSGIFHTAGRSCISRYEFALKIAEVFNYPTTLVQPVSSKDFKQAAERPKNSCLSVDDTERELGVRFLTAEEGLREMKSQGGTNDPTHSIGSR